MLEAGSRVLRVSRPHGDGYEVHIGRELLDSVGSATLAAAPAHRYAVVADSQVARLFGARVLESFRAAGVAAELVTFPAGEWNKTREQWAELSDRLLERRFGRDSAVIALGGGVTGDLAGFVAATFMRGVPVVQVPTTLLAMLDSSVGGKTGVDTPAGKNLIGAFHHPRLVLIDPACLSTLPRHQRAAGLAEAVKTAAILDADLFGWMESESAALLSGETGPSARLIEEVVAHKIAIVTHDPEESGRRAILNFGHTVGHALEALEGYTLLHGEAVAAGMRTEARLGEALEITEPGTAARISALLDSLSLDREWEAERSPDDVVEALETDKKNREGQVRAVFLRRVGSVAVAPDGRPTFELGPEVLRGSLRAALRPPSEA